MNKDYILEVIYLIIPFALFISLIFLLCFIVSVNTGQYNDLETPAYRVLLEDEKSNDINKKEKE